MNTAAIYVHAGRGVQPSPLYSVAGAVFGTALVCLGLLWAFTHTLPVTVPVRFMQLRLATLLQATPKPIEPPVSHLPRPSRSAAINPRVPKPLVIPEVHSVQPPAASAALDLSLPGTVFAPPAVSAFQPQVFNRYSDLYKELTAPKPLSEMQDGDAYHSKYGFDVGMAGGRCGELKTIQIGPSPSVRAVVGFATPCPGSYTPTMGDALRAWAVKRQAELYDWPP